MNKIEQAVLHFIETNEKPTTVEIIMGLRNTSFPDEEIRKEVNRLVDKNIIKHNKDAFFSWYEIDKEQEGK